MCRKAAKCSDGESLEVWGDGKQTRSFLYIDECIEAVQRLMSSNFTEPINIGSEEMVSINQLAQIAIDLSGKDISINNLDGDDFKKKYGHEVPIKCEEEILIINSSEITFTGAIILLLKV